MNLSQFSSLLESHNCNPTGTEQLSAKCPAHEDNRASLSVKCADDKILVHCHAGCSVDSICAALGITVKDLFNGSPGSTPFKPTSNGHHHKFDRDKPVATYDYVDESGTLLYQVCRYDPKEFRQRSPDGHGGWVWSTEGCRRVLYHLPQLIKAIADERTVFIAEGEKDVEALERHGFASTCNCGGAGKNKWLPEYNPFLEGAEVVIIADKDDTGRSHAVTVQKSIKDFSRSVKIIECPDVRGRKVKDAADFFAAGGKAAELDEIANAEPVPHLPAIENASFLLSDPSVIIPPEVIEGVLHKGCKAILGSSSKARKTWILIDLAISVNAGAQFWNWNTTQGRVLYINFEIMRPFMRSRIQTVCNAKDVHDVSNLDIWTLRGKAAPFSELLPFFRERIQADFYSLIVIDPVYKGLGGRDENSAGDISELCNEIEQIAVDSHAAIAFSAHYSKGNQSQKEAQDRIGGSGVFARDADSIITLTKHETEGAFTVDLILRNHPEQPPFVVAWQFPLMATQSDLNPDDLKIKAGRKPKYDILKLLQLIETTTIKEPISMSAWATAGNIPRQSLTEYTQEMRIKQWISTVGEGSHARQYITQAGLDAISKSQ